MEAVWFFNALRVQRPGLLQGAHLICVKTRESSAGVTVNVNPVLLHWDARIRLTSLWSRPSTREPIFAPNLSRSELRTQGPA
jgi:hypothetical protein